MNIICKREVCNWKINVDNPDEPGILQKIVKHRDYHINQDKLKQTELPNDNALSGSGDSQNDDVGVKGVNQSQ